ncbi:vWA domain-containing protein [Corynebacterium freiburgense]|uniref:vWA domain-containing protein n=1 Tax=Corynebacterium freiburgense TaxID=556548 RepID=UPI0003F5AC82|nr:VWA domain-containing protein [Corynebacterium freiburgense]WJZ02807.1 von Willebrand factor type A domain protein [Corynebacterium freiburgense]
MNVARAIKAMAAVIGFGVLLSPPTADAEITLNPTVIILDASDSMQELDAAGETLFSTTKNTLNTFLGHFPAQAPMGLVTYGASINSADTDYGESEPEADCQNITVVSDPREHVVSDLQQRTEPLEAGGRAAISSALLKANEFLTEPGKKHMVIIARGENTCTPPPACDTAAQLKGQDQQLSIHTIGIAATEMARKELQCIADTTGGIFAEASDTDSLQTALASVAKESVQSKYKFPQRTIQLGKDINDAPEVPVGTLDNPTRISAQTLTEAEEENGQNMLKLRIPEGHRLHIGYIAVPITGTVHFFRSPGGFVFSPSLQYDHNGTMVTCNSSNGTSRSNFLDTDAPKAGYLVSDLYEPGDGCNTNDVYLDLHLMRSNEYKDSIDIDMTFAAVPEPEDLGDEFHSKPTEERNTGDIQALSSTENVVAVQPNTQPEGAEELLGTTYGEISQGETHFYSVPVEWGQTLDGTLEVLEDLGQVQPEGDGEHSRTLELQVINALGQSQEIIGGSNIALADTQQPVNFGTRYPISYGNVHAEGANARSFWLGGNHYVALSFTNTAGSLNEGEPQPARLKYRLTLKPQGAPKHGPNFQTAAHTEETETATQRKVTEAASETAAPIQTTSVNTTLKIVGGSVAAAAVLITATAVLIKTRK